MAILSTPLDDPKILEVPLYYEKFVAYISPTEPIYERSEFSASDMPLEDLWVLEEGHCLRNQVFNFCSEKSLHNSTYEAGSIDTLVKIVDVNGGYTVIPELHVCLLTEEQKKNLRNVVNPEAVREIALVVRHDYVREGMMNAVANCVKKVIPPHMRVYIMFRKPVQCFCKLLSINIFLNVRKSLIYAPHPVENPLFYQMLYNLTPCW